MKDKLTILVTGSSGFSGQALIPKLRTLGYQVIGIDYKSGQYTTKVIDISKPFTIEQNVDTVIHLAARLEHDRCSSKEYHETNVEGTKNVLDIALKDHAFFIYVSSRNCSNLNFLCKLFGPGANYFWH